MLTEKMREDVAVIATAMPIYTHANAKDFAYAVIYEAILTSTLPPGTLITEKNMAQALSVSPTPVREAFSRLAREKMLDVFSQRGTYVSKIDLKLAFEARLMRVALEREIISRIPKPLPRDRSLALRYCLERQKMSVAAPEPRPVMEFINLDIQFHRLLFEAADLAHIHEAIQNFSSHADRLRFLIYTTNPGWDRFVAEHVGIFDALEAGDFGGARAALDRHLASIDMNNELVLKENPEYFTGSAPGGAAKA